MVIYGRDNCELGCGQVIEQKDDARRVYMITVRVYVGSEGKRNVLMMGKELKKNGWKGCADR
jgi:hypothetical protein